MSFFVHSFGVAYTFRGGASDGRGGVLHVQVAMLGWLDAPAVASELNATSAVTMLLRSDSRYALIVNLWVIRPVLQMNALVPSARSEGTAAPAEREEICPGLRLCRENLSPGHVRKR